MKTEQQQKAAFEVLTKNNALLGGKDMPFDKTTNYLGMLNETNTHRKLHGYPVYK